MNKQAKARFNSWYNTIEQHLLLAPIYKTLETCLRLKILKYKAEKHRRLQTLKFQRSENLHKLMYVIGERKTRTTPPAPAGPMTGDSSALRQSVGSEQKFLSTFFCRRRPFTQTSCARRTTHCQILIKMHTYHEKHPFEPVSVSRNTRKITRVCVCVTKLANGRNDDNAPCFIQLFINFATTALCLL